MKGSLGMLRGSKVLPHDCSPMRMGCLGPCAWPAPGHIELAQAPFTFQTFDGLVWCSKRDRANEGAVLRGQWGREIS